MLKLFFYLAIVQRLQFSNKKKESANFLVYSNVEEEEAPWFQMQNDISYGINFNYQQNIDAMPRWE